MTEPRQEEDVYRKFVDVVGKVKQRLVSTQPGFFFDGADLRYGRYKIKRHDTGLYTVYDGNRAKYRDLFSIMSAILVCRYGTHNMLRMVCQILEYDSQYAKYAIDCRYLKHAITSNPDVSEELQLKYEHCYQTALVYHNLIHKYCDKILTNGK